MNLTLRVIIGVIAPLLLGPLAAHAQQPGRVYRLGILDNERSLEAPRLQAFRRELRNLGWAEGQNLVIEARIGPRDQFPALADQLVRLGLDAIFAPKTPLHLQAASPAGRSIPIVIAVFPDPVGQGVAASLSRPGGNVTGLTSMLEDVVSKQLELLRAAVPRVERVAVFQNPRLPITSRLVAELKASAQEIGVQVTLVTVDTPNAVVDAFATAKKARADALLILPNAIFVPLQKQVAELAMQHRLPAMTNPREAVEAGLLMSYGPDQVDLYRRAAIYVDKILKGAKPGDLPVEQPTKFELVINLKTAKALGLTIPQSLLGRADEVIQ